MALDANEFKRPIPIALATVAAIGWIFGIYETEKRHSVEDVFAQERNTLQQQVSDANQRTSTTQAQLAEQIKAAGDLTTIRKQIEDTKQQLAELGRQRQEAEAQVSTTQAKLADLNKNLQDASLQLAGIEKQRKDVEAAAAAATNQANAAQGAYNNLKADISKRSDELTALNKRIEESKQQQAAAQQRMAQLDNDIQARQYQITLMQNQADHWREMVDLETKNLEDARAQAASQIAALQQQIDDGKATVDALTADMTRRQDDINALQQQMAALQQQRDQYTADVAAAQQSYSAGQDRLAKLTADLASRNQDLADASAQLQQAHAQLANQQQKLASLQQQLAGQTKVLVVAPAVAPDDQTERSGTSSSASPPPAAQKGAGGGGGGGANDQAAPANQNSPPDLTPPPQEQAPGQDQPEQQQPQQ